MGILKVVKMVAHGKLYSNKNKLVFVASPTSGCPTINVVSSRDRAKIRDDYSRGMKVSKALAKIIFK